MRNVIVTGGSRGLGLAIAKQLIAGGYRVAVVARSRTEALDGAMHASDALRFFACDLAEIERLPALVKAIRQDIGPIHGLVNNAAIGTSGVLATTRDAQIERTVRLNTLSPIVLSKHVVRAMMVDGGGRIVNIASIVGFAGFSGLAVYSATKAALIGFTRSLAREIGPLGITVNAIAPGFIDTEMTGGLAGESRDKVVRRSPLGRLAEPDDIANAAEYLLSDKARNITGTVLTVDAGSTA
jgi:3-oxoacyl-[acyl-carrier protein] reductase